MIARSSGSIRAESAVELTRSEKHHEELSMLGAGGADAAVATAGFGAFFSRASEFSYRAQQLPSMTERHLDLSKVLIRKVAQDCKAYLWCDNHGALTICLHSGGNSASVCAGFGLGGVAGCNVDSLNQKSSS